MDAIQLALTKDVEFWLRACAQIKRKDGSTEKSIKPNRLQMRVLEYYRLCQLEKRPCLIMILKPRQKGASTIAEAVIYHHMRTHPNLNGSLMGDIAATSDKVFEMFRRYYEGDKYPWNQGPIDEDLKQGDEITLPNGSKWYKETAGSTNAGRGGTIQVAHMEEVAFFPSTASKDPTTAYLGSFYKDGPMSLGFATSTANGATGWFYDTWNQKDNAWFKIFAAWFEFDDSTRPFENETHRQYFEASLDEDELKERELYNVTLDQLHWRRHIINTDYRGDAAKFRQEMPSNEGRSGWGQAETCNKCRLVGTHSTSRRFVACFGLTPSRICAADNHLGSDSGRRALHVQRRPAGENTVLNSLEPGEDSTRFCSRNSSGDEIDAAAARDGNDASQNVSPSRASHPKVG